MGKVGRLFVAVPITDEVRHGLAAHLDEALEGKAVPGRPVPPDNWHITLRFLGKTTGLENEKLSRALDEADLGDPFEASFGGLGAFPRPARATVLWLGLERGVGRLGELASAAETAATDAGFMPEERPFSAHLTLSRIRPHQDVRPVLERVPAFPLRMPVERVVVYQSHLGRRRPARYEEVEEFGLGPDANTPTE